MKPQHSGVEGRPNQQLLQGHDGRVMSYPHTNMRTEPIIMIAIEVVQNESIIKIENEANELTVPIEMK